MGSKLGLHETFTSRLPLPLDKIQRYPKCLVPGPKRKCSCLHGTSVVPSRADVARPRAKFILSLVSQAIPIPLSSQKCLGQLQSLLARENLQPQPPAREIIPIEISGRLVVRESHLESRTGAGKES